MKRMKINNIEPFGIYVLVKMSINEHIRSSKIAIDTNVEESYSQASSLAEVVSIGPDAFKDHVQVPVKKGDIVSIASYDGINVKDEYNKINYRLLRDTDIFCKIDYEYKE